MPDNIDLSPEEIKADALLMPLTEDTTQSLDDLSFSLLTYLSLAKTIALATSQAAPPLAAPSWRESLDS